MLNKFKFRFFKQPHRYLSKLPRKYPAPSQLPDAQPFEEKPSAVPDEFLRNVHERSADLDEMLREGRFDEFISSEFQEELGKVVF